MNAMKKPMRLRTQISILMALLVFLQSIGLVFALTISNVFLLLDAESFRLFNSTTSSRAQTYNAEVGQLVGNMAQETESLNLKAQQVSQQNQVALNEAYLNDEFYNGISLEGTQTILRLLKNNSVSGAFLVLNGSNSDKENANAHSSVYIRNTSPSSSSVDTENYLLEVGSTLVSREFKITSGINWELDLEFDDSNPTLHSYYTEPIWAAAKYPKSEIERYGYWSPPKAILGDNQQVITYTMPLLDGEGEGYGVLGIEISLAHFTQQYLPNIDLPYQNSFFAIAPVESDVLSLDWVIPSGPIAQVYLEQGEHLSLTGLSDTDLYLTDLDGLGNVYCSVHALNMYSSNSPFTVQGWSLVGFVPQDILHESSSGVRSVLIASIALTTLLSVAAIFLLAYLSTRKISDLSKHVASLSPYEAIRFKKTGMREIDELTAAVTMLNNSVINASKTTSKILELTLLPIGVYEINEESGSVVLTEYIYRLIGVEPKTSLSCAEWAIYSGKLTEKKIKSQDNVYQYKNIETGKDQWLRILEHETDTGLLGVVLDVTKDVEENRRLAYQLDYDALTNLYSRTAFKREAFAKIAENPSKIGAMIFSDLDNLKYINDTFGHDVGDHMIIRAGEMFREFKSINGIVARISGDEFAIYIHGFSSKEEARELIYDQLEKLEKYSLEIPGGGQHRIRSSSGIAWYPSDSDNVTDLLKLSDYAMYEAKNKEKGATYEFDRSSYRANAYLLENREAINRLLDEKLIRFAFQPVVSLNTGKIYGYEALMRPLLDEFKSPREILTVAAAQSKLGQLERLITMMAFEVIAERVDDLGDAKVFMNSVPSEIMSEEDHMILDRHYKGVFDRVVVEITEAENDSPQLMNSKVSTIKSRGMKLAIDDFGSGYSNEMRMLSVDPDIVKIDIGLVKGIHKNEDQQKLVMNIVSFSHSKGVLVVAEGVENRDDLEQLILMDVDFVQGYYIGRPDFDFKQIDEKIQADLDHLIKKHRGETSE